MKTSLILLATALISMNAMAKTAAECSAQLAKNAQGYTDFNYLENQAHGLPELKECKHIEGKFGDSANPQIVNSDVYLGADSRTIILQDNVKKEVKVATAVAVIVDAAVFAGRLVYATEDQRLILVTRNGAHFEMLTADKEPYQNVKGIKVDNKTQKLVIEKKSGPSTSLSEEQIFDRLNKNHGYRVISL